MAPEMDPQGSSNEAAAAPVPIGLPALAQPDADSRLAAEVKALVKAGEMGAARDRFDDLVVRQQRRASRIAYHVLRDTWDADEAVQDAFVKVFGHITSFREDLPFEVWFTRILINGCLDRQKSKRRRSRWLVPSSTESAAGEHDRIVTARASGPSPEEQLLLRERRGQIAAAVGQLPDRQRVIFLLCHYEGCSSKEVGTMIGVNESTVRVHLFRAVRKLRSLLGGKL
ncbi:MAG TPA: sigma-70 family RNA polymerase sigma factor [Vicinamibacterales bacterium]|nr:sigma-70 family RNA polymerase sigma factor [Vicinamibacterales bacterium]